MGPRHDREVFVLRVVELRTFLSPPLYDSSFNVNEGNSRKYHLLGKSQRQGRSRLSFAMNVAIRVARLSPSRHQYKYNWARAQMYLYGFERFYHLAIRISILPLGPELFLYRLRDLVYIHTLLNRFGPGSPIHSYGCRD